MTSSFVLFFTNLHFRREKDCSICASDTATSAVSLDSDTLASKVKCEARFRQSGLEPTLNSHRVFLWGEKRSLSERRLSRNLQKTG